MHDMRRPRSRPRVRLLREEKSDQAQTRPEGGFLGSASRFAGSRCNPENNSTSDSIRPVWKAAAAAASGMSERESALLLFPSISSAPPTPHTLHYRELCW